jgi:3-oxoacyl-[acyl-carrier-protein] synthase II
LRRVVVTGIGMLSPLGLSLESSLDSLKKGISAISYIKEWDEYETLKTRLGAPLPHFELPANFDKKSTRSMGRGALIATLASEYALLDAGLSHSDILSSGRMGIAYGSGTGGVDAMSDMVRFVTQKTTRGMSSTTYHRMMSHTCAANIGIFFGITGRVITTSSACTSGSLAIGYGYESIKNGYQDVMLCGGAEEFSSSIAAIFDVLFACSQKNLTPELTPRPFDKDRDGLVVGEAATTLILEEYEHAKNRDANIIAEVVGFGTNSDGYHITSPRLETVEKSMSLALQDANISEDKISYINAHATGTSVGDIVESQATYKIFKKSVPISSIKGYLSHTLGGSGSTEAALTIGMLNSGWVSQNYNLHEVDENCADLDYIMDQHRDLKGEFVMSNTFAFGGINTSLIFKRI